MHKYFYTGTYLRFKAIFKYFRTISHSHQAVMIGNGLMVYKIVVVDTGIQAFDCQAALAAIEF